MLLIILAPLSFSSFLYLLRADGGSDLFQKGQYVFKIKEMHSEYGKTGLSGKIPTGRASCAYL